MKKTFLFFIFLFSLFGAVDAQAFSISPLKIRSTIAPGDNKDWEIKVTNNSNNVSTFSPVVIGMKQDYLGRSVFDKNIDVAENWFKIMSGDVALEPGASTNLIFSVNVPLNTPPGAHYVGLAVQEKNGQALSAQLATVLNLQVAGIAQESLVIEKLFASKKIFFDKNWLVQIQFRNIGNVSLDLEGQSGLFYFGQKFSQKPFNLGNAIFAQSVRTADLKLFTGEQMALPGLYRADFVIVYGLTNQIKESSVNFWYLPYWFLASLGLIILLILFFVFKKNKNVVV